MRTVSALVASPSPKWATSGWVRRPPPLHPEADLAQIAQTCGHVCTFLRPAERGQEHGSEDTDDGNDDEEFDEGEGGGFAVHRHARAPML
jgi:hypothetical protein